MVSLWCIASRCGRPRRDKLVAADTRRTPHEHRHPGHRPSSGAAQPGRARGREAGFRGARHRHRPGQVDRLAPAPGPRAPPTRAPRRHRRVRRGRPLRALRQPARAPRRAHRARAAHDAGARATPPARPSTSPSPAPTPSCRSRRSTRRSCSARSTGSRSRCPPHCSALGKVFYAAGAIELPTGRPRAPYRPHRHRPRRPRPTDRQGPAPRGTPSRSASSRSGLDAIAAPVAARGGEVIAALGISGPSDRINHRLDALGELLTHHAAELSRALGAPAPTATRGRRAPHDARRSSASAVRRDAGRATRPAVLELTRQGLDNGMTPESMLFDALIPSLEEVGARFERGDFFVPGDADRRARHERRARASCGHCSPRPASRRSARS